MHKIWRTIIIGIFIAFFVFTYIMFGETGEIPDYLKHIANLLFSVLVTILTGFVLTFLSKKLNRVYSWEKNVARRFIIGILTNSICTLILTFLLIVPYLVIFYNYRNISELFLTYQDPAIKLIIIEFFIVFIYTIIDFSLFSYNQYAVVQIETVKLLGEQIKLQFEALKSQLSPHYLFNSLNTISSLVYKDPGLAEQFIRKLARTYQYILATNDKKLVKLSEELEFVKAYDFLLGVRFENAFQLTIDLPTEIMKAQLPPMSLQMLIENAVKHNVKTKDVPLHVNMFLDRNNYITVCNNLIEKPNYQAENNVKKAGYANSFGIGLQNIKKRYKHFTDKEIKIIKDESFTVKLPLI